MSSRPTWLRTISLLALLLLLGGYGYFSWMRLLDRQHIHQLDWQGPSLGLDGIHLAHLSLLQQGTEGSLRIEAEQLRLGWRQFGLAPPFWQDIRLERLALDWRPNADNPEPPRGKIPADLQSLNAPLRWLPRNLRIGQLSAELPCVNGRCALNGELQLFRHSQAPLTLEVQFKLLSDTDHLTWRAHLQDEPEELGLQLWLAVNEQPQLELNSSLRSNPDGIQWRGELSAPHLNQAIALRRWLSQWLPATPALPDAPGAAQLAASWQLLLAPGALNQWQLHRASGHFAASAMLAEPWPISGIGQVQGQLTIAARGVAGKWFAERLESDLHLQQISADWLNALPPLLQADSLHLRLQPSSPLTELPEDLEGRSLPLELALSSRGTTRIDLHAKLALANAPPWAMQLSDGRLTASTRHLALNEWKASELRAALQLSGYLDSEQLRLELGKDSKLELGELHNHELGLRGLSSNLQGLHLTVQPLAETGPTWRAAGPLTLKVQRLEQEALQSQGWRWQGKLTADQAHQEFDGRLSADAGLQLRTKARHDSARGLQVQARLPELFLRAGNPLAKVLADWPTLLDLDDGRLSADASLHLAVDSLSPRIQLNLIGNGLGGIYDRTAFNGLDSRVQFNLEHQQLNLELGDLRLEQANPGIPIGPILFSGRYRAPIARPRQGRLQVQQAQTTLLGGTVRLAPNQWNLNQNDLVFPLELQGLRLEQLFSIYPAEGLAGSATLDGKLPLRLRSSGIEIDQGQISARSPGGRLQFDSERIRALGQSNPTMELVAQSLEDFRFTTLTSRVDYAPRGKLNLAIRLEGRNPAIEQGRPIHFTINLEEDIPSLLASLQLTDKVSEIIKRRVQQRMLQRTAPATPVKP